ncbi:hypothetical protein ACFVHB_26510 [Kitasatospora sp. NPDC127111]|uniref:hypothetical protein n=1 Tax=Kitasatospora sp. NPDC127111 TaxID=3345363 RepID=UPI003645D268
MATTAWSGGGGSAATWTERTLMHGKYARPALGLSAALLLAACGSGGSGGGAGAAVGSSAPAAAAGSGATAAAGDPTGAPAGAPPTSAKPPAAPARLLGKAEVRAALLGSGDLSGYTVMEIPFEVGKSDPLPTRPADCQPIENIRTGKVRPAPAAYGGVNLMPAKEADPAVGAGVFLGSFEGEGAHQVLSALKTALTTCTHYEGGIPRPGTVAALPAPALGDEAVSYTLTSGGKAEELVVVRQGGVVAVFAPSPLTPAAAAGGAPAKTPPDVLTRQLEKLRKAAG